MPRAGREPGEFTCISYRYRQGFPDDIHVWTLARRVEACSGVSVRQEGLASEQEGFAVTGSLWEGAALTGAVIPHPGHREHLNRKEPDMGISGLLTHTFSQCKMQSCFCLHIHFPSKTVCQSTLIPSNSTTSKLPGLSFLPTGERFEPHSGN